MITTRFFRINFDKTYPYKDIPEDYVVPIPGWPVLHFFYGYFKTDSHLLAEGLIHSHEDPFGEDTVHYNDSGQKVTVPGAQPVIIEECNEEEYEAGLAPYLQPVAAPAQEPEEKQDSDQTVEEKDSDDGFSNTSGSEASESDNGD